MNIDEWDELFSNATKGGNEEKWDKEFKWDQLFTKTTNEKFKNGTELKIAADINPKDEKLLNEVFGKRKTERTGDAAKLHQSLLDMAMEMAAKKELELAKRQQNEIEPINTKMSS